MSQENIEQPRLKSQTEIAKALEETKADRVALKRLLDPLSRKLWTDMICLLEEIFPHVRGKPGCPEAEEVRAKNEKLFDAYKHRVLRLGNLVEREQHACIDTFAMRQLLIREVVFRQAKPHGPWGLPPGVKMPSEKER